MKREQRPLGTWGVIAVIVAMSLWTGALAYAQVGGSTAAASTTAR